jgi:hypothetical protein
MSMTPWLLGKSPIVHCAMRAGDHALAGEISSQSQITGGKFFLFDRSAAKQIAIAVVCHPLCTRQVTIKRTASARRFAIRVDMQHDPSNFLPLGAVGLGIKKTPIRHQMLFIVASEHRIIRSCVSDIRIEEWFLHHIHIRTPRRVRHGSVAIQTSVVGCWTISILVR